MKITRCHNIVELNDIISPSRIYSIDDDPDSFYAITLENGISIGITYYSFGIEPCVMESRDKNTLYIGFGRKILILDEKDGRVLTEKEISSAFYSIIRWVEDRIVFIGEIDLYIFAGREELYSMGFPNIICNYKIDVYDNSLLLLLDNEEMIRIPVEWSNIANV